MPAALATCRVLAVCPCSRKTCRAISSSLASSMSLGRPIGTGLETGGTLANGKRLLVTEGLAHTPAHQSTDGQGHAQGDCTQTRGELRQRGTGNPQRNGHLEGRVLDQTIQEL